MKKAAGFALIEVLVALALVGLALPALMMRMQSIFNSSHYAEEKTYAFWIADNVLQELIVEQQLGRSIARVYKNSEDLEYGGREWQVKTSLEDVPLPPELGQQKMYRVNIEVLREETVLANLTGYLNE